MGSKIIDKDLVAENGVLHVIDEIPLREECKFFFHFWKNSQIFSPVLEEYPQTLQRRSIRDCG